MLAAKGGRRPGAAVLLPPLVLVGLLGIVLLASGSSGTKQFASLLGVQGVADRLAALDAAGRGGGGPAALPQTAASQLLSRCTTFACLRKVHSMAPASAARFSFPHFMIIGFPKAATTSLAAFLEQHPQAAGSSPKEPQFFTLRGNCTHPAGAPARWGCDPLAVQRYIRGTLHRDAVAAAGLGRAAFEGSTGYVWGEYSSAAEIAGGIRRELPWLRLVVSMREPISQEISGRVHTMEVMAKDPPPYWYTQRAWAEDACCERLRAGNATMYECVRERLAARGGELGYVGSLQPWLAAWPRPQLHIVQYENLTAPGSQAAVLADVQLFLGLDPALAPAAQLPMANSRRGRADVQPEGWAMLREEYAGLVAEAREQAQRLASLLERHGFLGGRAWLAAWEDAWQRNLRSCSRDGQCHIQLT